MDPETTCGLHDVHKNITKLVKNVTAVSTTYFGTGLISQEKNSGCQNDFMGFPTTKPSKCFSGSLVAKPLRVRVVLHETAKWVTMESSCYETQHVVTAKDAQDFGRVADYNTSTFGFGGRTTQGPPLLRILNCQSPQNLKSVKNCFICY